MMGVQVVACGNKLHDKIRVRERVLEFIIRHINIVKNLLYAT
jgi:hypothetical protein